MLILKISYRAVDNEFISENGDSLYWVAIINVMYSPWTNYSTNLNFLLNLLYLRHSVGFKVVCVEVDKKYRKKLQTRYTMKLVYLTPRMRKKHFFKIFNSFTLNTKIVNAKSRICDVICDGILNGNRSLFYGYKKTVFKYLLRKK